jgi:hypothetical protein
MDEETRYIGTSTGPRPTPGQLFGGMLVWDGSSWVKPKVRGKIMPPKKPRVRQLSTPADDA